MTKFLLCLSVLALSACAGKKGDMGSAGPTGPGPSVPAVTPLEADIKVVLDDENVYRQGLGQTELTSGLSCTLSTFTSGERIQATSGGYITLGGLSQKASYGFSGVFNQPVSPISDGMNVLPPALRAIYLNQYLIRCTGVIVVTETDYYLFEMNSDDASLLYIGGALVIDNDNAHGPTVKSGMRYLRRGVHTFRLDYAQSGGGSQALILNVDGSLLNPMVYAH